MHRLRRTFRLPMVVLAAWFVTLGLSEPPVARAIDTNFTDELDLEAFRLIAVQHRGRIKTMDTLARETIESIAGTTHFERPVADGDLAIELDPLVTYLDMIFRPEEYTQLRMIRVKNRPVREALIRAAGGSVDPAVLREIEEEGRISPAFLQIPEVRATLERLNRDILRSAKQVDQIVAAVNRMQPASLVDQMRVVPPPEATDIHARWHSIDQLAAAMPDDSVHAGMASSRGISGLDADTQERLGNAWLNTRQAWRSGDVNLASEALNRLAGGLSEVNPAVYPSPDKRQLEHWYYRNHKMTWTWWFYLGAAVLLLLGVVNGWPKARAGGWLFFLVAFGLHTTAVGIRWYLAGRIPNANMFEAITAAAWFGAAIALLLELGPRLARFKVIWGLAMLAVAGGLAAFLIGVPLGGSTYGDWREWSRLPVVGLVVHAVGAAVLIALLSARQRGAGVGLIGLGASAAAMVALMAGRFMPIDMSGISATMPILNDLWLYIHVNMIIASYALIGIAFVTAAIFVVRRLVIRPTVGLWYAMLIPAVFIPLPATIPDISLNAVLPAWTPFLIVIGFTLLAYGVRFISAVIPTGSPAVAGIVSESSGSLSVAGDVDSIGNGSRIESVLDGSTMLILELALVMLWTGIVMGAIWADHSWGRPWGWDPKEVFALNTWIIFLILVHLRYKVRDKAAWTAVMAVIGCAVMLFNWIVVNFFITGLHSYA